MKKSIALILAALQLSVLLAACDNSKNPADTAGGADTTAVGAQDTTAPEETKELTEAEKRALIDDELPNKKFDNRDFIIVTTDSVKTQYDADEQSGNPIDDAIYNRNVSVEQKYDVKIETLTYADRYGVRGAIEQAVLSGDVDSFDLVAYHMVDNASNALNGSYLDWYEIPYIDFDKPWWADTNKENLTINGKCIIAIGDVNTSSIRNIYCYILNKDLASDLNTEDLYQLVRDGKWTLDKVREISEKAYGDLNSDGQNNVGDRFGLVSQMQSPMNTYQWSCDVPIIRNDAQGNAEIVLDVERLTEVVTKVVNMYHGTNGIGSWGSTGDRTHMDVFLAGDAMMLTGLFANMLTDSAEVDFTCGVLPYPKLNEEQKEYYTMVDGGGDSMGVSKIESGEDLEFIGLMTEALCAETYKQVYPILYDVMLKNRYADMPDDAEMMDICVNGRVYDAGYIYDFWKGAAFWVQRLATNNDTNVASYYAQKWPAAESHYLKSVLPLFED